MAGTTSTKSLRLSFSTMTGATHSITVKNPKVGLTSAEAIAAMDLVVAKNIFITTSGVLVAKKDIKVIDNTTTDLYDVPVA